MSNTQTEKGLQLKEDKKKLVLLKGIVAGQNNFILYFFRWENTVTMWLFKFISKNRGKTDFLHD